jgi:hypothetical protein
MILDNIKKELEIEKNRKSLCECCEYEKTEYLYITKMNGTIGLFHICKKCAYDPVNVNVEYEWTLIKKNIV